MKSDFDFPGEIRSCCPFDTTFCRVGGGRVSQCVTYAVLSSEVKNCLRTRSCAGVVVAVLKVTQFSERSSSVTSLRVISTTLQKIVAAHIN